MKRVGILLLMVTVMFVSSAYAQFFSNAPGTSIQEEDGDPDLRSLLLKFPNGSIIDNGDGSASISSIGGGGGGATVSVEIDDSLVMSGTITINAVQGNGFTATESPANQLNLSMSDIFVLTAGDTMSGNLAMGDNSVTGIDTLAFTDTAGTIAGIQNQNLVDKSATEVITGSWDFGGATSLEVPNGATPTVNAAGEVAVDTNLWSANQGSIVAYDGTQQVNIVSTTDTPADNEIPKFDSGTGTVTWEADTGGGSATKGFIIIEPQSAKISGDFIVDGTMQIDAGEGAWRGLFDDSLTEFALWQFVVPDSYSSAPTLKITYGMNTATTGSIDIDVDIMSVADGEALNTASFDTVNEVAIGTAVPGTAGLQDTVDITLTNNDSMSSGESLFLRISRDHDDTNDTATGDLEFIGGILEWTE